MEPPAATREQARKVYQAMIKGRTLEAKLGSLYKAGKIVGGVYIGKGQEAVSAALGSALTWGTDIFAPLIRDQAGRTAFGEDPLDATRTYLGSVEGPMRGRDGNIHRGRPAEGLPAMISHLGTAVSMVGGMLLARRLQGKLNGCVGATCIGDGATSTGSFHEGMNFVAVEKLPMVVIIADNQFAYSTPSNRQYACNELLDRAAGYGMDGHAVDGTDLLACTSVITHAVERARSGHGPQLIVAKLLRLSGHGEHDDGSYVPDELRNSHYGRDCLEVGSQQLLAKGWASEAEIAAWHEEASTWTQQAVATAQREAAPNPYQESWQALSSTQFHSQA